MMMQRTKRMFVVGCAVIALCPHVMATPIQLDFGNVGRHGDTPLGWNLMVFAQDEDVNQAETPVTLFDANGENTSVSISNIVFIRPPTVSYNAVSSSGTTNGVLPAAVGDDAVGLFGSSVATNPRPSLTLTFTGLDDTIPYTFEIYSYMSRTPTDILRNLGVIMSAGAGVIMADADWTDPAPLVFENVTVSGGFVEFIFTDPSDVTEGSSVMSLNAMRIVPIPEPASLALMGLGGLAILARQRKPAN